MDFKKIIMPVYAVVTLILLFIMLHLILIGPVPVTSIRIDGWNTRTVTKEEMDAGLKDFSYYGNYIKSESTNPWINLAGINEDHNMRYLYIDIEDISENNSTLDLFLIKDDDFIRNYYTLYQGVNIVCLEWNAFDSARIDLTSKYGVYFWINEIKFTDNYFLAIPGWFWVVYLAVIAGVTFVLVLIKKGKLYENKETGISKYWQEYMEEVINTLRAHKTAFIIGIILVVVIFGYEITNFTLGIDEEREIVHSYGTTENIDRFRLGGGEGRYSTILLKHLLSTDGVFTPYVDTLISVLGITAAAIIIIITLEKCSGKRFNNVTCVIFMGLFCSLPYVVTDWMCYSIINSSVSLGIAITSLAIYNVCIYAFSDNFNAGSRKNSTFMEKYAWLISSSVLCAFCMAIYECLAAYFMTSACFCVMFYLIYEQKAGFKQLFIKAVPFVISLVAGFTLYNVVKIIIGTNGYTSKFINWGKASFGEIITNWLGYLDYTFNSERPGSALSAFSVLCFVFILIIIGSHEKRANRIILIPFCGLCCFISTFALNILTGGFTPIRTMIPLMLLTSAPWIIAIEYLASYKIIKVLPIVVSAIVLLNQAVWVNKIFTGANIGYQLDVEWGYDVGTKIIAECPDSYSEKPLVFVGRYYHESPVIYKIDAAGWSLSATASKNMVYTLRYLGFDFIHSDKSQQAQGAVYAQDMPVYPVEGCIQEFDDMIVVRLS